MVDIIFALGRYKATAQAKMGRNFRSGKENSSCLYEESNHCNVFQA